MPAIHDQTPQVLAKNLVDQMEGLGHQATPRPWNYFRASYTDFYLITPTTEWPAYARGKYFVHRTEREGASVYIVGLYLESGHGLSTAGLHPRDKVRDQTWTWYEFLRSATASEVAEAVRKMEAGVGEPLLLKIAPHPGAVPGDCHIEFTVGDGVLKADEPKNVADLALPISSAGSFAELAAAMPDGTPLEHFWIDLFLGVPFVVLPEGSEEESWPAARIWDDLLSHLLPWFR
jgi:hypothetical protein